MVEPRPGELLDEAVIRLKTFKSTSMAKGASLKGNLEALSMVMFDFDYNEDVFDFDSVYYADVIKKDDWQIRMPLETIGEKMMIVYTDIYGNEYKEVKSLQDFSYTAKSATITEQTDA